MSQVEPASTRRPTRELKKTPKQKQIDEEKALKDKQIAERTLEKQSQNSNDPNYELIRKIAHCTGKNYAGRNLSAEELQGILDDPKANTTLGANNESTTKGLKVDQPAFAPYYPGISFGGNLDANQSSASTPTRLYPFKGASKRARSAPIDSPSVKKRRTQGSLVPPAATCHYSPTTKTDATTFYGGTPTRPRRPPRLTSREVTPLASTRSTTIMGGTPQRPIQARVRAGSRLKILQVHSQPLPKSTNPTKPKPTSASNSLKADPPHATAVSASAPNTSRHHSKSSERFSLPSHPMSPTSSALASPKMGLSSTDHPISLPPAKGKDRAQSSGTIPLQPAAHLSKNPASDLLNRLISERDTITNNLRAEMTVWQSRFHEVVKGKPLPPDLDALAKRVLELRERYQAIVQKISKVSEQSTQPNTKSGNLNRAHTMTTGLNITRSERPNNSSHNSSASPSTASPSTSAMHGSPRSRLVSPSDSLGMQKQRSNNEGQSGYHNDQQSDHGQRSEKEKRNKPILADFSHQDARVLTLAKTYALARLLARGIFKYHPSDAGPKLEREESVYRKAWDSACLELHVDRPYRTIFGKWMGQRRSTFINHSAKLLRPIVDNHLDFTTKHPQRNIAISRAASGRGCHKEENGRAFQSPLLHRGIHALLFDSSHPYGVLCPELFRCIPSRLIAYVCAILQYIVNGYRKGPWNNDRLSASTQAAFFRQFLKDYEKEENRSENTRAWGRKYRKQIYTDGQTLYEAAKPIEDPMPEAEGTWSSDMEMDFA
ncbi:unnamed protein product [Rhizoctonia solani]|uniref:DUF6532 domain-containing protein n=1 Tax=Rhizoctonia solani TaxID=456999 RepID=A0A8H2WLC6_9AGAM|nr:unnamed protein product [Rhizoctonia solani]